MTLNIGEYFLEVTLFEHFNHLINPHKEQGDWLLIFIIGEQNCNIEQIVNRKVGLRLNGHIERISL